MIYPLSQKEVWALRILADWNGELPTEETYYSGTYKVLAQRGLVAFAVKAMRRYVILTEEGQKIVESSAGAGQQARA